MIRALVLFFALALLADMALGDIENLLQVIGLGGPRPGLGIRLPGTGVSWNSPIGEGYIGYGR
ncbi:uncharacterized protein Sfp60F [Drosophila kikkawai]|uniref:Uncharacterized protein Sfp60F n=1 Tax=Drosophila kikkawai TaxID=30033 RepID=A0ABM4GC58_DROKI